jgi:probable HAF family extracellular repeat protein
VVGTSQLSNLDGVSHAFAWRGGRIDDLNSLIDPKDPLARYVTLVSANGVNDSGWIVANGIDSRSGEPAVYLLTVKDPPIELQRLTGACSHH